MRFQLRLAVTSVVALFSILVPPTFAQLSLRITVDTGFTEIVNDSGVGLSIDGYSIASPGGQLGGEWISLTDQGLPGWDEADNSNETRRTEFNPVGSSDVASGAALSLGSVFVPVDGAGDDVAFQYTQPDGATAFGNVQVSTALSLQVDRGSGEVTLLNRTGGEIDLDGYTIGSPSSSLGDDWNSLQDQSISGWDEADNSNATRVTEFNPSGSTIVLGNQSISLGQLYSPSAPDAIGETVPEDLSFQYTSPNGKSLVGDVEYSGALNNVVMTIDPATGSASIQNQSPFFDIAIDAYTITSADGNLDTEGWSSLAGQGVTGWDAADNVTEFRLTEFNPTSQSDLAGGGAVLDLGTPFDPSTEIDLNDLSFQYLPVGGEVAEGLIVFGELAAGCFIPDGVIPGDLDGDGGVQFLDFLIFAGNFGQEVSTYEEGDINCNGTVDFLDFLVLAENFGTSVQAAAVPEPTALSLCFVAATLGLLTMRVRRT